MEKNFAKFWEQMNSAHTERSTLQEHMDLYKTRSTFSLPAKHKTVISKSSNMAILSPSASLRGVKLTNRSGLAVTELDSIRSQLSNTNADQQGELEETKSKLCSTTVALEDARRTYALDMDDLKRKYRNDLEDLREEHRRENDRDRKEAQDDADRLRREHLESVFQLEQRLRAEIEEERNRRLREVQELQAQWTLQKQNAEFDVGTRDREMLNVRSELAQVRADLEQERIVKDNLKEKLSEASVRYEDVESSAQAMKTKINFLESDSQQQSQAFADLNTKTQEAVDYANEANAKLRAEETLRRKLHNQVQELKGNIRVFCRVRPALDCETEDKARITFPDSQEDSKELSVMGPEQKNAMGKDTTSKNGFSFDRVFGPASQNPHVFDEISQLIQSALDGYNVCIFCYGQTGSGKTHTMSAKDGMIPLAVSQIYDTAHSLEEKGWKYSMEGSFVEVYNENLNDLLGKADDFDKKKHEIRHDHQSSRTSITDVNTVTLESPATVTTLLKRATANRSVAATKANERSSRSHSVFILKLTGENSITGERSGGTLNLVDLAGSERLTHSGATGDRLKETQNINRSLSCLGDVISALGQGKDGGHIPYRNSKVG